MNLGSSERPLTRLQIEEKFFENAARVVPEERALALRDAILNIDCATDVGAVTGRLGLTD